MYELQYRKKVIKALTQINDPYYSFIIQEIEKLTENPCPFGYKKLTGRNGFRIRVGSYRIMYDIFENILIIEIINLGVEAMFTKI
ncbi:MAG: type II toxin-antitoxin system RelE/ParE family toxin [Saprospiraceae bacterium]